MKINYLDENKKRKNNSIESGFKYDSVLKTPKSESLQKAGSLGYAPKIVSTPKTPRFTLSDLGKNSGFNTVPALNEGARIKNNIKNVIAQKEGELNVRHIFDGIDDKTVERNIPVAQNAINNSIRKGTLKKTQLEKLPNLLDGLTMFYASAEKGKPKAEKLSRNAAYTEVVEKLKDIGIPKMQNPNLFANTKGSFNDSISEIQKNYGIDTQTPKASETIKSEDKAQDMYSSVLQNLPMDANIEVKPEDLLLTSEMVDNGDFQAQKLSNKASFNYDDINEILSRAEKLPGSLKKEEREFLQEVLKNPRLPIYERKIIEDILAQPEVKITSVPTSVVNVNGKNISTDVLNKPGIKESSDNKYRDSVVEEIEFYDQVWHDAELAYELGIIDVYEKDSLQLTLKDKCDQIRKTAENPVKSFFDGTADFSIFDLIVDYPLTVYAADLSRPALEKMYGNDGFGLILFATSAIKNAVETSDNGRRTIINTKTTKGMARVDIEYPQGNKPAQLHVQVKGIIENGKPKKYIISSLDDLDDLPNCVKKNSKLIQAIKKGLKTLSKLI